MMPDNYSQWEAREAKREAWLLSRPVCQFCKHPIQEDRLFDIDGDLYHTECAETLFRRSTEGYVK